MFIGELILALIIAFLLAAIFASLFGWERPGRPGTGPAILFMFLLLFGLIWAVGVWITPFGPPVWGVYWLPFLLIGLVFALLIFALIPPRRRAHRPQVTEKAETEAEVFLGGFFWVLFIILAISLFVHYT